MNDGFVQVLTIGGILLFTLLIATVFRVIYDRIVIRNVVVMEKDKTSYLFLKHFFTAVIYLVGIAWAGSRIEMLRTIAGSILAGAGILAVVVGFASQHALSNIVSGIFIVVFKPFRIKDRLQLTDVGEGTVEDITLRHTVIRDWQNRRIIIPNSIISDKVIVNADLEDTRICRHIEIGISYDSDIDLAKKIFMEEVLNHPHHIDGRTEEQIAEGMEEVPVRIIELGDFSVLLRAWAWAPDQPTSAQMRWDVLESVKKRFDKEGVEIPFPYRTIVMKKDLLDEKTKEDRDDED